MSPGEASLAALFLSSFLLRPTLRSPPPLPPPPPPPTSSLFPFSVVVRVSSSSSHAPFLFLPFPFVRCLSSASFQCIGPGERKERRKAYYYEGVWGERTERALTRDRLQERSLLRLKEVYYSDTPNILQQRQRENSTLMRTRYGRNFISWLLRCTIWLISVVALCLLLLLHLLARS